MHQNQSCIFTFFKDFQFYGNSIDIHVGNNSLLIIKIIFFKNVLKKKNLNIPLKSCEGLDPFLFEAEY